MTAGFDLQLVSCMLAQASPVAQTAYHLLLQCPLSVGVICLGEQGLGYVVQLNTFLPKPDLVN